MFRTISNNLKRIFFVIFTSLAFNLFATNNQIGYQIDIKKNDKELTLLLKKDNVVQANIPILFDKKTKKFINKKINPSKSSLKIESLTKDKVVFAFKENNNAMKAEVDIEGNVVVKELSMAQDLALNIDQNITFLNIKNALLKGKFNVGAQNITNKNSKITVCKDLNFNALKQFLNEGFLESKNGEQKINAQVIELANIICLSKATFKCEKFNNKAKLTLFSAIIEATLEVLNDSSGSIVSLSDLNFLAKAFENAGRIDVANAILFNIKNGTWKNIAGTILANTKIDIITDQMTNGRGLPVNDIKKVTYKGYCSKHGDVVKIVEESHPQESSESGVLACRNGSINIIANKCRNIASIISAKMDINIITKFLENEGPIRKHISWNIKKEDIGFIFEHIIERAYSSFNYIYCPSSITAGRSITVDINGKQSKIDKNNTAQIAGVKNTGFIGCAQDFLAKAQNRWAEFVNGNKNSNIIDNKVANPFEVITLSPNLNDDKYKFIKLSKKTNPNFIYTHPNEIVNINQIKSAYIKDSALYKDHKKHIVSPLLFEELVQKAVNNRLSKPLIDGFSTSSEQFEGLLEFGLQYAIINGALEKIGPAQESKKDIKLSNNEKIRIQELIKMFGGKILPKEYLRRKNLIDSGSHIVTLSKDQINKSPLPLLYSIPATHDGKKCMTLNLHLVGKAITGSEIIAKNIFVKNFKKFLNFGKITGLKSVKINAKTVKNQKNTKRIYNIETTTDDDSGSIIGGDIEIEATGQNGVSNVGGAIYGTVKVKIFAKNGNVENKPLIIKKLVKLDPKYWNLISAKDNTSVESDLISGVIKGGDVELQSEVGQVIIEASRVIADNHLNIKAYGEILLNSLFLKNKHVTKNQLREDVLACRASLSFLTAKLESTNKNVDAKGTKFQGQDLHIKSKESNILGTISDRTEQENQSWNFNLFGLMKEMSKLSQDLTLQTEIDVKNSVIIESELDNAFEAVVIHAGELVHIVAGRDNIFNGKKETIDTQQKSYSLGVSFFGSESIKKLVNAEYKEAIWALTDEDPLIKQLKVLQKAQTIPDKIAEAEYASIEALRLIMLYRQNAKNNTGLKGMFGQRLGITNAENKFEPKLTFGLGKKETKHSKTATKPTEITTAKFVSQSGRNTKFNDATKVNAKEGKIAAKGKLELRGTVNEESLNHDEKSVSVNTQCGLGYAQTQAKQESKTVENTKINIDKLEIDAPNVRYENANSNAKNTTLKNTKELTVTSTQSESKSENSSCGIGVSPVGFNGSYSNETSSEKKVLQQSGIKTEQINANVQQTSLTGGYVEAQKGIFNSKTIDAKDIHNESKKDGFGIAVGVNPSDVIPVTFDLSKKTEKENSVHRTTLPPNVKTESDISQVNRDPEKKYEVTSKHESNVRVALPVINIEKFNQAYNDIKEMFAGKKTLTAQQIIDAHNTFDDVKKLKEEKYKNNPEVITQAIDSNDSIDYSVYEFKTEDEQVISVRVSTNENANINENTVPKFIGYGFNDQYKSMSFVYEKQGQFIEIPFNPALFSVLSKTNGNFGIVFDKTDIKNFGLTPEQVANIASIIIDLVPVVHPAIGWVKSGIRFVRGLESFRTFLRERRALSHLVKPLNRCSTGRTEPRNLHEKLAMEEVMSNPQGKKIKLPGPMREPWNEGGWVKKAQNVKYDNNPKNGIEIHYLENELTGHFDDFKFKDYK